MNQQRLAAVLWIGALWHGPSAAQVLEYIDCEVRDPAAFIAANEQFYNAMGGGVRPTVSIDANLWNGASPVTHTVIVAYESHQALEAFFNRIGSNPGPFAQLVNTINHVARCENEGLAVQLGAWGDMEAAWEYYAVYPLVTSDPARYGAALAEYAESIVDEAPGSILYYQNRAGEEGATHFVVFLSPSLAGLNEFLDNLTTSDAYAEFVEEVAEIRILGTATQAQRVISWAP